MIGRGRELEVLAEWFRGHADRRACSSRVAPASARPGSRRRSSSSPKRPACRAPGRADTPRVDRSRSPRCRTCCPSTSPPRPARTTSTGALSSTGPRRRCASGPGTERLLLMVDDGDQLDELSRALVASLVQSRGVFAVLTMRTTGGPTPFDHLVKDGHLLRLTVEPLPVESIETLLHRVLGGPIVGESLRRLRDAAMGNPGVLRQLVETARAGRGPDRAQRRLATRRPAPTDRLVRRSRRRAPPRPR